MNRTPAQFLTLGAAGVLLSCGGSSQQLHIDPTGGEVCLPDNRVCITIPGGAVDEAIDIRVSPTTNTPPALIGEGVDISVVGKTSFTFKKPAEVRFKTENIKDISDLELKLRIYSRASADAEWEPIDAPKLDRVKKEISGTTLHLSPFVLLRTDLLPDGGLPIGTDAGIKDGGGVIIVPPVPDAGRPDAGRPDAGRPDSGAPDAGPIDSGVDAGVPDAGTPDASVPDAGAPDAGPADAGAPDAGQPDAGPIDSGVDAGLPDAGTPDAGSFDAGAADAGAPDAGGPSDAGSADSGAMDAGAADAGDAG